MEQLNNMRSESEQLFFFKTLAIRIIRESHKSICKDLRES